MNTKSDTLRSPAALRQARTTLCWALALLLFAMIGLDITGCQSPPVFQAIGTAPTANPGSGAYATNVLHQGDLLGITFQYSTNFDTVQKIALDGTLNLVMVGPVKASGKTVEELQQDLLKSYQPADKDDVITVKLLTSAAVVYVSGAVLRPGTVELDRPLTVLEAIMGAGGFDNSRAKLSDVVVLRTEKGQQESYRVNLKRVLEGKDKTLFYVKPFDVIYVPAKTFNF